MNSQNSGAFLYDAVLSLGAMHAVNLGSPEGPALSHSRTLAIRHYSNSVSGLRRALDRFDQLPDLRHGILWTTHLLGLFEVKMMAFVQGLIH